MKRNRGIALTLALLITVATGGGRSAFATGTDVVDADTDLYIPFWSSTVDTSTLIVLQSPFGPATAHLFFYDANCTVHHDLLRPLSQGDVEIVDPAQFGITGEGAIRLWSRPPNGTYPGPELTAEAFVTNHKEKNVLHFHHINENDGGVWNFFANFWTGVVFDPSSNENELFLFCPTGPFSNHNLADNLTKTGPPPFSFLPGFPLPGALSGFATQVSISIFDDQENLLDTFSQDCKCVTRVLLNSRPILPPGSGRIEVRAASPFSNSAFIAYMRRQTHKKAFYTGSYLFSHIVPVGVGD